MSLVKNTEKRCLILDDSMVNLRFLSMCLEELGITTSMATNTTEAYNLLNANIFEVSLIDLHMPHENGSEFVIRCSKNGLAKDLGNIYIVTAQIDYKPDSSLAEIISGVMYKPLDITDIEKVFFAHT